MSIGKVKLNFKKYKKQYEYPINVGSPTPQNIALEVSKQILGQQIKRGMKRQTGGLPCFNLILDLIRKQNVRFNMPKETANSKEQCFLKAKFANDQSPWLKIGCCHDPNCEKCKGQGEYYTRTVYRVGKNTSHQLIVETDNSNVENAKKIKENLEMQFGYEFKMVKTTHGFHIIGIHNYLKIEDWLYANCLVINQNLRKWDCGEYIFNIEKFDEKLRKNYTNNFKEVFCEEIKKSGLFSGIGDFDILYTVLSIKYKKSTLRISKKIPNDNYEMIE